MHDHSETNWANKRTLRMFLIRHGEEGTQGLNKQQLQQRLSKVTDEQRHRYLQCLLAEKRVRALLNSHVCFIPTASSIVSNQDRDGRLLVLVLSCFDWRYQCSSFVLNSAQGGRALPGDAHVQSNLSRLFLFIFVQTALVS